MDARRVRGRVGSGVGETEQSNRRSLSGSTALGWISLGEIQPNEGVSQR